MKIKKILGALLFVGVALFVSITGCKSKCDCTNCQTEECCASCSTTVEQVETDSTAVPQDTVNVESL